MPINKPVPIKPDIRFRGYANPNYTMVPDELFDEQLPYLSGAEVKALLYIMRRTFGFKKTTDDISLSQICEGITTREGKVLDRGTGLSRSTAQVAIKGLVQKNLIHATRRYSAARGFEATTYSLNLVATPYTENRSSPIPKSDPALDRKSVIQETVEQKTEIISNKRNSNVFLSNYAGGQLSTSIRAQSTVDNPLRQVRAVPPPPLPADPKKPSSIGHILAERYPHNASTRPSRGRPPKAPAYLAATMEDIAAKLHDENPRSSLSRAAKLWKGSGLPEDKFVQRLHEASSITRQQGSVAKRSSQDKHLVNRIPYFFAVVEDLLGLKGSTAEPS